MPNIKVLDVVSAIHKRVREQAESFQTPAVLEDWSNDLAKLHSACNGAYSARNTLTVPPLFDYCATERPAHEPRKTLEIGYVGNCGWWPNLAGLRWFLGEVFPNVQGKVRLHAFGQHSERAAPDHPCITKHGVTDRIAGVWGRCDILICPEFVGGGVGVKFAEAVYNRMPVLARTYAARGVALGEDPAILLLDEPREWVEFLLSPMARAFGRGRVSERVAKTFAIETHKDALQKFVSNGATSARSGRSQAGLGRWTRH